jgi:RimJ/RimL family protein N-acetyltransferase
MDTESEIDSGDGRERIVLRGGESICIRPIRAGDLALHSSFVAGLSTRTGYARLFSMRKPGDAELRRWTDIDHAKEAALVATVVHDDGAEEEIGVVRYVREDAEDGRITAGFAAVIADAWQGRGLARELLQRLITIARRDGIEVLTDLTQYDNRAMLALARKLGFQVHRRAADGANVTRLTLRLS